MRVLDSYRSLFAKIKSMKPSSIACMLWWPRRIDVIIYITQSPKRTRSKLWPLRKTINRFTLRSNSWWKSEHINEWKWCCRLIPLKVIESLTLLRKGSVHTTYLQLRSRRETQTKHIKSRLAWLSSRVNSQQMSAKSHLLVGENPIRRLSTRNLKNRFNICDKKMLHFLKLMLNRSVNKVSSRSSSSNV